MGGSFTDASRSRAVRYHVVAPIARGGMGEVYLALRTDGGFRRLYALKRLRPGFRDDTRVAFINRPAVPFLLAGSGGGYFRMGRRVDCAGRAHNDLYVSICHAMGLDDVTSFGNRDVCMGPIPGLT